MSNNIIFKYDEMDAAIMYSEIINSKLPSEIQEEDGNIVMETMDEVRKQIGVVFSVDLM